MDGWITIGADIDTKSFDKQMKFLENKLDTLEREYEGIAKASPYAGQKEDLVEYGAQIEKVKNQIISLKAKTEQGSGIASISDITESISKKTNDILKKVSSWALGVFGVRTAYNMIQRASSTLAQYDKQYATDLQYIQYVLAQAIAPVLRGIVNLVYTLLQYVNYLANAWFGINLFGKANAKNFASMASSAKTIHKELAGFDEMNVMSDTSSAGGAGGFGGMPSMDLSSMNGDVPEWLRWIAENKEIVLGALSGIAGGLTGIATGLGFIKGVGIGVVLDGVIGLIQILIEYLNDPSFENFGKMISRIGEILLGFGLITGSVATGIIGGVLLIAGYIISNWDTIKGILNGASDWINNIVQRITDWFITNIDTIQEKFGYLGVGVVGIFTGLVATVGDILRAGIALFIGIFDGIRTGVKQIVDGIIMIFKGDLWVGLESIGKGIVNMLIGMLNGLIGAINVFLPKLASIVSKAGSVVGANWNIPSSIPKVQYLATGGIINMPGRGVNLGGAYGGERGAEGVIPLSDSQAMETLGKTIGKYITINANITNKMNGRVLSRELQRITSEDDFAYNS